MIHTLFHSWHFTRASGMAAISVLCCLLSLNLADEDLIILLVGLESPIDVRPHATHLDDWTLPEVDALPDFRKSCPSHTLQPDRHSCALACAPVAVGATAHLPDEPPHFAGTFAKRKGIGVPLRC